jgi:hypothetical protein
MECHAGCGRPAKKAGLCWACRKAQTRHGRPTLRLRPERGVRHKSKREMVKEAIEAYNDADPMNDGEQRLAWQRLRTAWRRFFGLKPTPRKNTVPQSTKTPR